MEVGCARQGGSNGVSGYKKMLGTAPLSTELSEHEQKAREYSLFQQLLLCCLNRSFRISKLSSASFHFISQVANALPIAVTT